MFCKHCGRRIEEDSTFCRYCGKSISQEPADISKSNEAPETVFNVEPPKAEKQKEESSIKPSGCFLLIAFVVVAALTIFSGGSPSKSSNPVEEVETDYEQIGHEYGVEFVKLYLEDIGVYEYDRLGWYYPETYTVKDGIHYTSSKFDYYGTDHTYSIGIKYDSNDEPTVVFFSVDDDRMTLSE